MTFTGTDVFSTSLGNLTKIIPTAEIHSAVGIIFVELEGIEPSSKQGNHMLSTRLSQPSVFVRRQDLGHPHAPYPLKLHSRCEATGNYPRFSCTTESECFGATASE